jgi:hypothetical protein
MIQPLKKLGKNIKKNQKEIYKKYEFELAEAWIESQGYKIISSNIMDSMEFKVEKAGIDKKITINTHIRYLKDKCELTFNVGNFGEKVWDLTLEDVTGDVALLWKKTENALFKRYIEWKKEEDLQKSNITAIFETYGWKEDTILKREYGDRFWKNLKYPNELIITEYKDAYFKIELNYYGIELKSSQYTIGKLLKHLEKRSF